MLDNLSPVIIPSSNKRSRDSLGMGPTAGAPSCVRVRRSWPARFTEKAGSSMTPNCAPPPCQRKLFVDETENNDYVQHDVRDGMEIDVDVEFYSLQNAGSHGEPHDHMSETESDPEEEPFETASEEEQADSLEDFDSDSSSDGSYWWSDSSDEEQSMSNEESRIYFLSLEDTIDVESPYHLHPQDQRWVSHEIFLFWYPEVNIEAHRMRMAGRMVRSTFYTGELRIIRPTVWVIDMHDEGRSNLVGSFEIWGITVFIWLSHRYDRQN